MILYIFYNISRTFTKGVKEMKRLTKKLISIISLVILSISLNASDLKKDQFMKISIESNGNITVYELNNSQASKELLAQLPLNIKVENYSNDEKIFYPPSKLSTSNTPLAKNAITGTLAYYAPWGDVVMFYKDFGSASGLYELGKVVSGKEYIKDMSGNIEIKVID